MNTNVGIFLGKINFKDSIIFCQKSPSNWEKNGILAKFIRDFLGF